MNTARDTVHAEFKAAHYKGFSAPDCWRPTDILHGESCGTLCCSLAAAIEARDAEVRAESVDVINALVDELAWVKLIEENEEWARRQPRTLEREHVLSILADIRTNRAYYDAQPPRPLGAPVLLNAHAKPACRHVGPVPPGTIVQCQDCDEPAAGAPVQLAVQADETKEDDR